MHDGRFATLEAVLAHYSRLALGPAAARIDPRLPRASLTEEERGELKAFLESLTDRAFVARFAPAPSR
jgi:cytochrome c peroxidase